MAQRSSKDERKRAMLAAVGAPDAPTRRSRRPLVFGAIGLVAAVVASVAILSPKRPVSKDSERAVEVRVAKIESLREFTRLSDASATVATPVAIPLSFDFSGRLAEVVEKGANVKAGQIVASLDGAKPLAKELARAKEKEIFYEEELASARAGAHPTYVERAERKYAEKKQRAQAAAASLAGMQIASPRAGTITSVGLGRGSAVTAKTALLTLQPTERIAEFQLPDAEAKKLEKNQMLELRTDAGARGSGRVFSSDKGTIVVELQGDSAQLKLGDRVRFVREKITDAAEVPITAVQTDKATARDRIFTVDANRAAPLPVGILDRRADHATVTGLKGGERVIVDPPPGLKAGALVSFAATPPQKK